MTVKVEKKKAKLGVFILFVLAVTVVFFTVAAKEPKEEPVTFTERESAGTPLTKDFFYVTGFSFPRNHEIDHIMLHFTSAVMVNFDDPYVYEENKQIFLGNEVSTHYIIDREGVVYQWIPESRAAWHAGKGQWREAKYTDSMNFYSIGIELMAIGSEEEMGIYMDSETYGEIDKGDIGYTEAQYKSLHALIDDIVAFYPEIEKDREHILGHDQYSKTKVDPGELFDWTKIGLEA